MATWRCPHCGTPQAETSRCWVCSKSPLSCRTCRDFRRAVAGPLGYCALDREHMPLDGDEVRACWQAPRAAEPWEGLFSELPRPSAPDTERVGDGAVLVPRPLGSPAGSGIAADSALPGASHRGFETAVEGATDGPSVRAVDARSTPAADARAGSAKDARAGSAAERAGVIPIESRRPAVAFAVTPASGPAPGRLVEAPLVRPAGRIATTAELRARANLRADVEALLEGQRNVGPRKGPVS